MAASTENEDDTEIVPPRVHRSNHPLILQQSVKPMFRDVSIQTALTDRDTTKRRDGLCPVHAIRGRHGGRPSAAASLESSFNLTPVGEARFRDVSIQTGLTDRDMTKRRDGLCPVHTIRGRLGGRPSAALEFEHGSSAWTYSVRGLVRLECTDGYCSPAAFTFRLRNQTASTASAVVVRDA